jgi:hypothetical protein
MVGLDVGDLPTLVAERHTDKWDRGGAYPEAMSEHGWTPSRLSRLLAPLVDIAPAWIWRPANFRQLGPLRVHFCFGHEGKRTVEINGREIIVGNRSWDPGVVE